MGQPLILLFGMPRSGTTWLGKIFDSHPNTLYRHEPDSRGTLNTLPLFAFAKDAEKYRAFLQDYVGRLPTIRDEKVSASIPIFPKRYYSSLQYVVRKALVFGTKAAARLIGPVPVPGLFDAEVDPEVRVVWKSIESLGRLGVLAKVFETSRCVIIFRHPCGYVASVLRGEAKRKFEGVAPLSEDWGLFRLLLELPAARARNLDITSVRSMVPVERLALIWALVYEHALNEAADLKNVLAVRYEDCCEDPKGKLQELFQHCQLDWAPEVERFVTHSVSRNNGEYYSVFKDPQVAAERWKKELGKDDAERVLKLAARFRAGSFYGQTPTHGTTAC